MLSPSNTPVSRLLCRFLLWIIDAADSARLAVLADPGEQPRNQAPVAAGEHVFGGERDAGRRPEEILPQGRDRFLTLEPRLVGRRNGRLYHAVAGHDGHHTINFALVERFVVAPNYAYGGGVGSLHVIRVAVSSIRRTPVNAYPSLYRHRGQGCREAFIYRCHILIVL